MAAFLLIGTSLQEIDMKKAPLVLSFCLLLFSPAHAHAIGAYECSIVEDLQTLQRAANETLLTFVNSLRASQSCPVSVEYDGTAVLDFSQGWIACARIQGPALFHHSFVVTFLADQIHSSCSKDGVIHSTLVSAPYFMSKPALSGNDNEAKSTAPIQRVRVDLDRDSNGNVQSREFYIEQATNHRGFFPRTTWRVVGKLGCRG
ncbi:MAG: hypothetical protein V1798_03050 [Pseudomonadota bacterium]